MASAAAGLMQVSVRECYSDPTVMSKVVRDCQSLFGYDALTVLPDPTLEAEALGREITWSEHGPPELAGSPPSSSVLGELETGGIVERGRCPVLLSAAGRLVETARDTPVLGMVTGPATLARSFLGQSWEKTESGMETLSRLGEEVIALTRAFCERRIDGVVVLDPALVELPGVLFEGVVRLFRTMHNLTQFYDARLLLATSLPEKADPGFLEGLSVDGVSDGRWEGAGESRGASAPVRGIAIPPSAWGEEIEERVRAAVAETTQDRAYITTDGEVPFGTPADRLHEVMDALEG